MVETISLEQRTEAYKREVGFEPQALFILSGGVRLGFNKEGNPTRSTATSYADSDNYGMLGGKARPFAAAQIAQVFPDIPIYTLSQNEAIGQISWKVYRDELVRKGVSEDRIISIPEPATTLDEITQIVRESVRLGLNKVAIITNDYHQSRGELMVDVLEYLETDEDIRAIIEEFKQRNIDFRFVSAENILEIKSPRYKRLFERVKKTPQSDKRIENEARGAYKLIVDPQGYVKGRGLKTK